MNIFYLDSNPQRAAQFLCDKHMKMALETAQILSSVSWRYAVDAPYKPTHVKHPSVLWAGNSKEHWGWLVQHGIYIGEEYHRRYGKSHKSIDVIRWCRDKGGSPPKQGWVPPPTCMPDIYKTANSSNIESKTILDYQTYYQKAKMGFATWRTSPPPWWAGELKQCEKCCLWAAVEAATKWKDNVCASCAR